MSNADTEDRRMKIQYDRNGRWLIIENEPPIIMGELATKIFNAAIEMAALDLERICRATKNNQDETIVAYNIDAIRKLKID